MDKKLKAVFLLILGGAGITAAAYYYLHAGHRISHSKKVLAVGLVSLLFFIRGTKIIQDIPDKALQS